MNIIAMILFHSVHLKYIQSIDLSPRHQTVYNMCKIEFSTTMYSQQRNSLEQIFFNLKKLSCSNSNNLREKKPLRNGN